MLKSLVALKRVSNFKPLCFIHQRSIHQQEASKEYESVFKFPFIKYVAVLNRLKVYQIVGTSVAVPGTGILQTLDVLPQGALLSAAYIGLTGTMLLSLASIPFKNSIGFLYISADNNNIKISSVDFWGKRIDKEIKSDEWIPLLDMPPKLLDNLYLTPQLTDGTKYKLFVRFGQVLNKTKMGQVLE